PYRQIGHRAVSYVMDRSGIAYAQDEVRWLVGEIEKLKPFPYVVAALEKLRALGYKLTILSTVTAICCRPQGRRSDFGSTTSFCCRRRDILSRTGKPMPRQPRSSASIARASSLLPITPSIASARNPRACGRRSSTAGGDHSARRRRISPTPSWPISPS